MLENFVQQKKFQPVGTITMVQSDNVWQKFKSLFQEPPVSDRDRILLTPFQQWRKYRQFPLKIALHFLIVVFVSSQVCTQIFLFNIKN